MSEAKLVETGGGGLEPGEAGWFVVNVADTSWWRNEAFGASCPFEANDDEKRRKANVAEARFQEYGINIHVVWPGQPNCMYHGEDSQEDFLVLHGECLLLVEGQDRPLKAWDFVHFPPWTEHVVVGAGSGPCAILMAGTRAKPGVIYPLADVALKHGAGVEEETRQPADAYARFPEWKRTRLEDLGLPWQ